MPTIGDALRGYGSVLNPQVAAEVAAEDRAKEAQNNQIGMLLLQKKIQESSPQYQAQLEALNNEKAFRAAAAEAGGNPVKIAAAAAQYGKPELAVSLYNQQEARQQRLQQASEALEFKRQQLEQQKGRDAELLELKKQGLALQAQIAQGAQDLKRMQFNQTADQQTRKQVQQLGAGLEKANLPQTDAVLADVESTLRKNPNAAEYISGPKSSLPDMLIPDDAKFARQSFQKLFNITLKDRSGAAVTNQELERLKQEFATGAFKTQKQLETAVEKARNIINKHYAGVAAGYSPDVLKAYNENIRGLGGRVVLEPSSSGGASGGNVLRFDKNGNPIP